jgi:hypothetical protein
MSIIVKPKPKRKQLQLNIRITTELADELDSTFEAVSRHQKTLKADLMRDALARGLAAIKADVATIEQAP